MRFQLHTLLAVFAAHFICSAYVHAQQHSFPMHVVIHGNNPAGTTIALPPGNYTAYPTGTTAVNPWSGNPVSGCDSSGANCAYGWVWRLHVIYAEHVIIWRAPGLYAQPSLAAENVAPMSFSVSETSSVLFWYQDCCYSDNDGMMQIVLYQESGFDDCNGNGFSDWYDIQIGVSQDTNGDGIPDECGFVLTQPSTSPVVQSDSIPIAWIDGDPPSGVVAFFLSTDLSAQPWTQPGSTQIATFAAASTANDFNHPAATIEPGTYSVWGRLDIPGESPIYARAPGNVTVTAVTENDEPELLHTPLDLAAIPGIDFVGGQSAQANNLFLVTHGWNGLSSNTNHGWITHIAENVRAYLDGQPHAADWNVATYFWNNPSLNPVNKPGVARENAFDLGHLLGIEIHAAGYGHVEVVAHSAGTWLADGIADRLAAIAPSGTSLVLHLLDPYAFKKSNKSQWSVTNLGNAANASVASYVHDGFPPQSNALNPNAYNVDVSCWKNIFKNYNWPLGAEFPFDGGDHGTPWAWFRETTRHAAAMSTFIDHPMGFGFSKAYNASSAIPAPTANWALPFSCGGPASRSLEVDPVFVLHRLPVDLLVAAQGSGGNGDFEILVDPDGNQQIKIDSGGDFQWVSFRISLDSPISGYIYDAVFESAAQDAEGFLINSFNGTQLASLDERFKDWRESDTNAILFDEIIDLSEIVLSFRLDANGGPESSARISNIYTGVLIQADINGDGVLDKNDPCAWVADPTDLNGDGVIDEIDLQLLADALGVSEIDSNNSGIPDICEPCPGDINGDGIVNLDDFAILAVNFGAGPGATPAQGDLNGDGFINLDDFAILAVNFGNDCN